MYYGYKHTADIIPQFYDSFTDCKENAEITMDIRGLAECEIYHHPFSGDVALIQKLTRKAA